MGYQIRTRGTLSVQPLVKVVACCIQRLVREKIPAQIALEGIEKKIGDLYDWLHGLVQRKKLGVGGDLLPSETLLDLRNTDRVVDATK
ncbi:MAG: hypothetical protein ACOC9D_01870 [Thermodesulfobacteriota bacterium]